MTSEPLDESYFKWLYIQVASLRLRNPTRTFYNILGIMHRVQFLYFVPNDDNRAADGIELRYDFLSSGDFEYSREWLDSDVSILEMMIALSRRLAFEYVQASSTEWFWQLMKNLDIVISDHEYRTSQVVNLYDNIIYILETLNNRTYDQDGRGGLFPLVNTLVDQRRVEIWSQLNYYINERS